MALLVVADTHTLAADHLAAVYIVMMSIDFGYDYAPLLQIHNHTIMRHQHCLLNAAFCSADLVCCCLSNICLPGTAQ